MTFQKEAVTLFMSWLAGWLKTKPEQRSTFCEKKKLQNGSKKNYFGGVKSINNQTNNDTPCSETTEKLMLNHKIKTGSFTDACLSISVQSAVLLCISTLFHHTACEARPSVCLCVCLQHAHARTHTQIKLDRLVLHCLSQLWGLLSS